MKVETARFGVLNVDREDVIRFDDGILGCERLKEFCIVDLDEKTLILWLQSTKEPEIAFPILEPKVFDPDYAIKLLPGDLAGLNLTSLAEASVYTVLTIPPGAASEMTANLKAPVVINNASKCARQIVLQDGKLSVCLPIYNQYKEYTSHHFSGDKTAGKEEKRIPTVGGTRVPSTSA